ncbi:MAG: RNA polymerase sigma factor [Bacteroidota bacterium]
MVRSGNKEQEKPVVQPVTSPETGDRVLSEIIQGCRRQNRMSQERLYRVMYAYGMSITLLYADSRTEAVTMLNDAFLKVFDSIERYDTERPFKPWFRQIVVRTAIDHYRKRSRHHELYALSHDGEMEVEVDERILDDISYRELIALIHKLSPAYRTVFTLYAVEGYGHNEIARMLDIAVGTSKSNLARARAGLRELIEQQNRIQKDVT